MRIAVTEFISLDGVVQAPGGAEEDTDGGFRHGGWSMPFFDPEVMGNALGEQSQRTEALLYGRRTWRVMADAWPNRAGDEFADWINAVPKYVVTDTPQRRRHRLAADHHRAGRPAGRHGPGAASQGRR